MLYDELVPQGEYLVHYGIPKDQWSPEARAKHDRNKRSIVDEHRAQAAEARRRNRTGKNADNSSNESKALNPNLITRVAHQINRSQENVNGRRRLSELGRNGQLVKQNSDMNRFLTSNGLNANSLRINPKGYNSAVQRGTVTEGDGRSHLKTNKRAENGKSSSRTSKPTPSSQSADQAIARNMRSGSSTKKNRKDQPNKKGNGSKKK